MRVLRGEIDSFDETIYSQGYGQGYGLFYPNGSGDSYVYYLHCLSPDDVKGCGGEDLLSVRDATRMDIEDWYRLGRQS
jgi:hypothetical protein